MINWVNVIILLAVAIFFVFARKYIVQHGALKSAARKPFNDSETPPIENRSLKDSEGYIPLDNLVISEIPVTKAQEISHFEVDKPNNEINQK